MKSFRLAAVTTALMLGAFSTLTYISCNTDKCATANCPAGTHCVDGDCVDDRTKFIKTWTANDMTPSGMQITYTSTITPDVNGLSDVIISAIRGDNTMPSFFGNTISATVDGDIITIPLQKPDPNGDFQVSGTGTYSSGVISWSYRLTQISTSTPKDYTGTWN